MDPYRRRREPRLPGEKALLLFDQAPAESRASCAGDELPPTLQKHAIILPLAAVKAVRLLALDGKSWKNVCDVFV